MKELLERILIDKPNRKKLIKHFQKAIWDSVSVENTDINQLLSELAYDLDFYEPDENLRSKDPSYYGEERLEEEIKMALQKLQRIV